ncbi:unnamed protein product [Spirodela intermedia]|uniref:Late embryogenesis abundant protein LEA-2 subgroup domain-containing protein n=1 Tax=Spirodela intermedia TaxID=51605 RepID=A0A7I8K5U7_SPIIN|nr:unnamed protein product [Spirodela intermedia]CAB1184511.1 unnamed protein product [Spirodela intermedia]
MTRSEHTTEEGPSPGEEQEGSRARRRRRHRAAWAGGATAAAFLTAAVVLLVVALTVFKPRQLETTLRSAAVEGVAPRVALPWGPVELNVTLSLDFAVFNPNRASFDHAAGKAALFYRGKRVGDADVAPGRIPSRGSAHVYSRLTVEADRFAADPLALVRDVLTGHLDVDSSTRIPGRVTFLGFIHHHVVILTDCHVTISFPPVAVTGQQCQQKTE